jgi:hypothetical protein
MAVTHRPGPAAQENIAGRRTRTPVDELILNRHETAVWAGVESPSRAAGGFPTLGGGVGAGGSVRIAGRGAGASRGAVGRGGGAG